MSAPTPTTTFVADLLLEQTVEDGYRQEATLRKFNDGDELHIRESFGDGSASNVYIRREEFAALVVFAAKHGFLRDTDKPQSSRKERGDV